MTTTSKPSPESRGFGSQRCPLCNEDAVIQMDLDNLVTFTCRECGEEFTREDVLTLVARPSVGRRCWPGSIPLRRRSSHNHLYLEN